MSPLIDVCCLRFGRPCSWRGGNLTFSVALDMIAAAQFLPSQEVKKMCGVRG